MSPSAARTLVPIEDREPKGPAHGSLVRRVVSIVASPRFRPPVLPAVAMDIRRLVTGGDVSPKDLLDVIGTDPLLTGRLLAVARDRDEGGIRAVRTLQSVVAEVGAGPMSRILADAVEPDRIFRARQYAGCLASVRRHAITSAWFAHLLAHYTGTDPNESFLAALLHDVGFSAGLVIVAETGDGPRPPAMHRVWAQIDAAHAEASRELCAAWGLAPDLCAAIHDHHKPGECEQIDPLTATLFLANQFAKGMGVRVLSPWRAGSGGGAPTTGVDADRSLWRVAGAVGLHPEGVRAAYEQAYALLQRLG